VLELLDLARIQTGGIGGQLFLHQLHQEVEAENVDHRHGKNRRIGESVNPYVVASYTGSMFTIRGKYGHDTSASEAHYGVDGSVTPVEGLTIRGYWEANTGDNEYAFSADLLSYMPGLISQILTSAEDAPEVGTWISEMNAYADQTWGIGASYQVAPNLSVAGGYSTSSFSQDFLDFDDLESYAVGVDWNAADNLVVRMNYRHQEWGDDTSSAEVDEFRVRVRRTF